MAKLFQTRACQQRAQPHFLLIYAVHTKYIHKYMLKPIFGAYVNKSLKWNEL